MTWSVAHTVAPVPPPPPSTPKVRARAQGQCVPSSGRVRLGSERRESVYGRQFGAQPAGAVPVWAPPASPLPPPHPAPAVGLVPCSSRVWSWRRGVDGSVWRRAGPQNGGLAPGPEVGSTLAPAHRGPNLGHDPPLAPPAWPWLDCWRGWERVAPREGSGLSSGKSGLLSLQFAPPTRPRDADRPLVCLPRLTSPCHCHQTRCCSRAQPLSCAC